MNINIEKIALIGFMGSGKTLFGRALARFLNYPFVDLDDLIEKKYKMSISQIFKNYGENYFRNLEREEFFLVKSKYKKVIFSVGGGFPCYKNNMNLLKTHFFTVFLYVPFEKSYCYIKNDPNRPLVKKGKEFLEILYKKRLSIYLKAHMILKADIPVKGLIKKFKKYLERYKYIGV